MRITGSLFMVTALSLAACGGDDGDGDTGNTTTDPAAASASVRQTAQITSAIGSGDGGGAASAMYSFGAAASAVVALDPSATARRLPERSGNITGDCNCDASGCTFNECGDDDGVFVINGEITINGDDYTFDVDMSFDYASQQWEWAYDGALTASPTLLDGALDGVGSGTFTNPQDQSQIDFDWKWGLDYNAVALDAAGCATGGSVDASVSYAVSSSSGGAGNYSGSGHVEFGPACGQAQ